MVTRLLSVCIINYQLLMVENMQTVGVQLLGLSRDKSLQGWIGRTVQHSSAMCWNISYSGQTVGGSVSLM